MEMTSRTPRLQVVKVELLACKPCLVDLVEWALVAEDIIKARAITSPEVDRASIIKTRATKIILLPTPAQMTPCRAS